MCVDGALCKIEEERGCVCVGVWRVCMCHLCVWLHVRGGDGVRCAKRTPRLEPQGTCHTTNKTHATCT